MVTDGYYIYHGEHLVMYIIVDSWRKQWYHYGTPGTNVILYNNYISIKNKKTPPVSKTNDPRLQPTILIPTLCTRFPEMPGTTPNILLWNNHENQNSPPRVEGKIE